MAGQDLARFRAEHATEAARAAFLDRLGAAPATPAAVAAAARSLGYQVTEADFRPRAELAESELDQIAGAGLNPVNLLRMIWG
ncbi:Nif11 family protein [Pseudoroseomonas cervicalis]|uniref:Nif11 family protein n=1 Tax=Teichococcus cervicalis TaxID=204525 RepID=UPI00277E4A71|nr:Nif11 family protein [Pseudoroseomonas cervicalis]MDQ1080815.1 putative nicotinamide N-methyase [Pseudoroseomonas cervicalis]